MCEKALEETVRYKIKKANRDIQWWITAGMDFTNIPRRYKIQHTNLPYHFYMLLLKWNEPDKIIQ